MFTCVFLLLFPLFLFWFRPSMRVKGTGQDSTARLNSIWWLRSLTRLLTRDVSSSPGPLFALSLNYILSILIFSTSLSVYTYTYTPAPFFLSFLFFLRLWIVLKFPLGFQLLGAAGAITKKTARSREMTRRWYFIFRRHTSTQSVRPSDLHRSCFHGIFCLLAS